MKSAKRKRRQAKQQCSEIIIAPSTIATINQEKFFSNDRNKRVLILEFRRTLSKARFETDQATEDADFASS